MIFITDSQGMEISTLIKHHKYVNQELMNKSSIMVHTQFSTEDSPVCRPLNSLPDLAVGDPSMVILFSFRPWDRASD
jgi:hypothetical protein